MFWLYLYKVSTTPFAQEKIDVPFAEAIGVAELRMEETGASSARLTNFKDNRVVWRKFGRRNG